MHLVSRIFYLFFLLVFITCHSSKDESPYSSGFNVYQIDIGKQVKDVDFSNFFELESIIQLETTPQSLVSNTLLVKAIFFENKIFFADDPGIPERERLMVFDMSNGNYLYDIGQSGDGPEDFFGINDFVINHESRSVYLLASGKMAIMEYGLDGSFRQSVRSDMFGEEIEFINNDFIVYNELNTTDASRDNFLVWVNKNGKVIKRQFTYDPQRNGMGLNFSGFLDKTFNCDLLFSPPLGDTIFVYDQTGALYPKFIFDLGVNKVPYEVKTNIGELMGGGLFGKTYLNSKNAGLASGLLIEFNEKDRNKVGYFHYTDEKFYTTDGLTQNIINRIFNRSAFFMPFDKDKVALLITSEEWFYIQERFMNQIDKIQEKYPSIAEKILSVKENDNPAILIFHVKAQN